MEACSRGAGVRSAAFLGEAEGEGGGAEAADDQGEGVVPEAVAVEVPGEFVSVVAGVGLRERGESHEKRGEEAGGFHERCGSRCERDFSRRWASGCRWWISDRI